MYYNDKLKWNTIRSNNSEDKVATEVSIKASSILQRTSSKSLKKRKVEQNPNIVAIEMKKKRNLKQTYS
ncbi:1535_t:CDS:2 [Scutellospora calospora]|uniref:1535_t:CDS:1 n=1 Tax=Scutellospora calospora TaxID=85575 RepID=A0ACA9JUJ4_9GLOM|nr:1535_t:CDS:2 [Scutellospora calospora]